MTFAFRSLLVTNPRVWFLYRLACQVPGAQRLLRPLASLLFPRGRRLRGRVQSGLAKSLLIQFDARYEAEYVKGAREPEFQKLLQESLRRGDLFVDVGAHTGFFVLCAAALVGREGRIVALEPDPENCERLVANAQLNGLSQVDARCVAAWSSRATLEFKRSGTASGRSEGHIVGVGESQPYDTTLAVEGVPLDDLVREMPKLVKVDVEGAEIEVLRGAKRMLAARRAVWAVECHSARLAETAERIFREHGYDVARLRADEPVAGELARIFVAALPAPPPPPGEGASGRPPTRGDSQ